MSGPQPLPPSMAESASRQPFEADGDSLGGPAVRDMVPGLSSHGALARFEFEAGRANEGTKVLMVEWEDETDSHNIGDWEVSWEGKSTVVPESELTEGMVHRVYFLLPPGSTVPPIVKITRPGGKTKRTNPLPAIFPPELGASAKTAGKKGVLHTKWGKQRLSALQKEIDREMQANGEGVGLEMALQEKQWIEQNFGIGARTSESDLQGLVAPSSPKSPGTGRLAEKLRGLKLGTSTSELFTHPPNPSRDRVAKFSGSPLSPETGDIAVSSFSIFHGGTVRPSPARAVAQSPPSHILAQQGELHKGIRMNSLDAVAGSMVVRNDENDTEDGLFAVSMLPRSPEMAKSPFSFSTNDMVQLR